MKRGRFDERCPHCNIKFNCLNQVFSDNDYQTDFKFQCPNCRNGIQCDVHLVPEFELSKAQTPAEYRAMVAAMRKAVEDVP